MKPPFLPLALIAAAALSMEVALTRFFAVAHFSEYGYWVLSIAMTGFALSGLALSLWEKKFRPKKQAWLHWLPLAVLVAAGLGYLACGLVPFNALELQHPETLFDQVMNIGLFYLALFPFFFLSGLYIGICLAFFEGLAPRLYAWDLGGAGLGAGLMLAAMWLLPPLLLPAALLPLPALAAALNGQKKSALAALGILEAALFLFNPAGLCEYKQLAYSLKAADAKVLAHWHNPRGEFHLVQAYTERLDLDLSNSAGSLHAGGLPPVLGLYRDGDRIAPLARQEAKDLGYFKAALESFPYSLKPSRVLLAGTRGGMKQAEARAQARALEAQGLESDPEIARLAPGSLQAPLLDFFSRPGQAYDLIDLSAEIASQDRFALSVELLRAMESRLSVKGLISLPVSVQETGAWAARMLKTLPLAFGPEVGSRVVIYRSAWNARFLIFKSPQAARRALPQAFCRARSFDLSWNAGAKLGKAPVFNDLPTLGWMREEEMGGESSDALAREAARAFAQPSQALEAEFDFDSRPATLDRPFFFSSLRLDKLGEALANLPMLPREELPLLVNLAVLAQALALALGVLLLPLFSRPRKGSGQSFPGLALYFSGLGLAYLFFEVALIEKISPWIQDRATAFGLVLAVLLLSSGLGSFLSPRFQKRRWLPFLGIGAWALAALLAFEPLLRALAGWPGSLQALVLALFISPLGLVLGMPFPLGLSRLGPRERGWAWAVNGACSVLSPPLAFLLARGWGYKSVAGAALLLYFLSLLSLPKNPNPHENRP